MFAVFDSDKPFRAVLGAICPSRREPEAADLKANTFPGSKDLNRPLKGHQLIFILDESFPGKLR